jgi:Fur family transcriptional regulator, ferric uptake regulator
VGSAAKAQSRDPHAVLSAYMDKHGLKASRQRDTIAEVFFSAGGHLTVEDLLRRVRAIDSKVSQATVYRTMRLLTECGLAHARNFHDGQTRYELSETEGEHHDHLICTSCGSIVEFVEPKIEELQDKVASRHGFTVTDHKMELYGLCAKCRAS